MHKTYKLIDKNIYKITTRSNLDVYLIPFDNTSNFSVNYIFKYGANYNTFIPYNAKDYKTYPLGIAHFLEHKIFEKENENAFEFASKYSSQTNAYTDYDATNYYFIGNKKISEHINYLVNMVNNLYLTFDTVEKEKGIIKEELKMYLDDVDFKLRSRLCKNLFIKYEEKEDIGGTCDTVDKITKEDLFDCFHTFYNTNNSFMVISGKFNVDKVVKTLIDNPILNKVIKKKNVDVKREKEELFVVKEYDEVNELVGESRCIVGYKMPVLNVDYKYKVAISILLMSMISNHSRFYHYLVSEEKVNNLCYDYKIDNNLLTLFIEIEKEDNKRSYDLLNDYLKNYKINVDDINRIKKVILSNFIYQTDNYEKLSNYIINNILFDNNIHNIKDTIEEIDINYLEEVLKTFNFDYKSVLYVNKIN